ncbi:hypothetical protein RRG08_051117 [Elysia crispata]|uniref:Uncharacterized protein n=1 Tax=Elysia crispata TaxID=231223 RepID=A0AAE1AI27_9GAST|nr:hypothetical protein RRG08_051117 [Elysia crispata]
MGSATFEWDRAGKVWDKQHSRESMGSATSEYDRAARQVWDQQHLSGIEQADKYGISDVSVIEQPDKYGISNI